MQQNKNVDKVDNVKNAGSKVGFSFKLNRHFFGKLVVVIGVVMVWRGLWNLLDMFILPGHPFWSSVVSIVLGLLLLYLPDNDIKELV